MSLSENNSGVPRFPGRQLASPGAAKYNVAAIIPVKADDDQNQAHMPHPAIPTMIHV